MNFKDALPVLEPILKQVAPATIEALGGPWAELIGLALTAHFNVAPTPSALTSLVSGNPSNAIAAASRFEANHSAALSMLAPQVREPGSAEQQATVDASPFENPPDAGNAQANSAPEPAPIPVRTDNLKSVALAAGELAAADIVSGKPVLLAFQIGPVGLEITYAWRKSNA